MLETRGMKKEHEVQLGGTNLWIICERDNQCEFQVDCSDKKLCRGEKWVVRKWCEMFVYSFLFKPMEYEELFREKNGRKGTLVI